MTFPSCPSAEFFLLPMHGTSPLLYSRCRSPSLGPGRWISVVGAPLPPGGPQLPTPSLPQPPLAATAAFFGVDGAALTDNMGDGGGIHEAGCQDPTASWTSNHVSIPTKKGAPPLITLLLPSPNLHACSVRTVPFLDVTGHRPCRLSPWPSVLLRPLPSSIQ